jgi:hypothetical protein
VTIADAYTYGLGNLRLVRLVRAWADSDKNRLFLRAYAPRDNRHQFLRVISRVYVTGRVSVTVNNDEATSAEAGAGADRPVTLLGATQGDTKGNYNQAIESINTLVKDQLPGVKLKIAIASSRSVTLDETFERPLVVGYAGFDMPILDGGRLGMPLSTLAQLEGRQPFRAAHQAGTYRLAALAQMHQALVKIPGPEAQRIRAELDTLVHMLPDKYPFSLYQFEDLNGQHTLVRDQEIIAGAAVERSGFTAITDYLGNARMTMATLSNPLAAAELQSRPELRQAYQEASDAVQQLETRLNQSAALMKAIDFVFFVSE